jgi:hypothetical protein
LTSSRISKKLEIITLTTNFVSNMLSVYIIYRSIPWVFKTKTKLTIF